MEVRHIMTKYVFVIPKSFAEEVEAYWATKKSENPHFLDPVERNELTTGVEGVIIVELVQYWWPNRESRQSGWSFYLEWLWDNCVCEYTDDDYNLRTSYGRKQATGRYETDDPRHLAKLKQRKP